MAFLRRSSLLATSLALLSLFSLAVAQAPSNDTLSLPSKPLFLQTNQQGMSNSVELYALTERANLSNKDTILGPLKLVKALGISGGEIGGSIACITCDPAPAGQADASQTINLASGNSPKAIVLFSNTSRHCAYPSDSSPLGVIYTAISNATLTNLEGILAMSVGNAVIKRASDDDSTNGTGYNGRSPTTAVAMIILYSITGIITALFLMIIVVGAIRAHRHPERYGPRNLVGRPRQSRARGIARAMLETIPIVKFGEKEPDKPVGPAGDVELGQTARDGTANRASTEQQRSSTQEQRLPVQDQEQRSTTQDPISPLSAPRIPIEQAPAVDLDGQKDKHSQKEEGIQPEAVTTETVAATAKPEGHTDSDANAENGLACSVCTDDFTKGQDVRVLPCNHKFHPECIDPWLLNVSGTCPLCRVDLRPTTSHTSTSDANTGPDESSTTINAAGPADDTLAPDHRRSRTGLSLYIQHTLNRRRMRDATPEERVAALRRLRTVNSAGEQESTRNRLSARLSRVLHSDSRRGSVINPSRRGSAINQEESRRGSYAG